MYRLWIDNRSDGWQFEEFETKGELIERILQGDIYNPIRLTKDITITILEDEEEKEKENESS